MKKIFMLSLVVIMSICLSFANAFAGPSGKVVWNIRDVDIVIPPKAATDNCPYGDTGEWEEIFTNTIKAPKAKGLIISVSLECEVSTNSRVKPETPAVSEALVEVLVRVLVGGVVAEPGEVIFARRFQALVFKNPDNSVPALVMVTANHTVTANSFNFIVEDVPSGNRDITVEAKIIACQVNDGDQCPIHPETTVSLGKGTVVVESVKILKGKDSIPEL